MISPYTFINVKNVDHQYRDLRVRLETVGSKRRTVVRSERRDNVHTECSCNEYSYCTNTQSGRSGEKCT